MGVCHQTDMWTKGHEYIWTCVSTLEIFFRDRWTKMSNESNSMFHSWLLTLLHVSIGDSFLDSTLHFESTGETSIILEWSIILSLNNFQTENYGPLENYGPQLWLLGESEGRWATHRQGGEWGTDERDGDRTGVIERLPSTHPTATSARCVWTQVHGGVVSICSDQPVFDRCVVVGFVERWKEDFVNMINRNFAWFLMMGVFSRVCSGMLWGWGSL